ncbi:MAG: hypothetical protein K2J95_07215 [Lachnospiraceae bacterium]|nr:hypothetical protein [Lachnospiraceae bacterium]
MKREVAVTAKAITGFPWSECQWRIGYPPIILTTSHCTMLRQSAKSRNDV